MDRMSAAVVQNPVPPQGTSTDSRALVKTEEKQLPELKSSDNAVDKSRPLPTSLMSDFIPEDVLFALTQPPPVKDQLGPPSRIRNLNTSTSYPRPPPNGVWNHKRRERFKHLTDNPPCICGAGQDISFLYDVPSDATALERPDRIDKSAVRKEMIDKQKKPLQLPDTLIPEEYHIVKNKGVMGIEFHEDKYSTQIKDHEKHLVMFPSMKPTSRYEVLQLKKTFSKMMTKLGITEVDVEVKGPTQIHNLLELIKKEQTIFDTIFSELIRQTTIECVERGELLSDVRNRYKDLINNVPKQIMSLHEEVIAQRALDRRLTEELMRFKSTIGILTSELSAVKEHDKKVTREAKQAQEDLKEALSEAQKNASLLSEYHALYELQRKRLEKQVSMLTDERELWSNAAYSLALKVTEEANLVTAKRLHVNEKSWVKLATHFTILLSDRDTQVLTNLQGHVERWRDLVEEFKTVQHHREVEMKSNIKSIRGSVEHWMNEIRKICFGDVEFDYYNAEGQFRRPPDDDKLKLFLHEMKHWEEILSKESEKYGGETLLEGQDKLTLIRVQMEGWTDNALKVFSRHRKDPTKNHPDQDRMVLLNQEVESLLHQFDNRITGENGVASRVIHLTNGLETWDMKLTSHLNGTMSINDNEWGSLVQLMEDWLVGIDEAMEYVGNTQKEEDREKGKLLTSIDVTETVRKVQKWASSATNYIDSEDALLVEQVSQYHSKMVLWMVQMLLRLAPDKEGNSKEAAEMALIASLPLNELHSNVKVLIEQLEDFSRYVALSVGAGLFEITNLKLLFALAKDAAECCQGIVVDNTEQRRDMNEDNPEHELKDLNNLRHECKDWMHTAKILTSQLLNEPIDTLFPRPVSLEDQPTRKDSHEDYVSYHDKEKLQTGEPSKEDVVNPEEKKEPDQPDQQEVTPPVPPILPKQPAPPQEPEKKEDMMEVIGHDDNTHKQTLESSTEAPPTQTTTSVIQRMADAPDPQKSFEALSAVDVLQNQLITTEQRAQEAEERSANLEVDLAASQEKVRELEKRLAKLEQGEALPPEESTASTPQKVEPVSPPKTPSKEKSDSSKEEKKRPESTASKSSSKSGKSKKK